MKKLFLALTFAFMASGAHASILSSSTTFVSKNRTLVGTAVVSTAVGACLMHIAKRAHKKYSNFVYFMEADRKDAMEKASLEDAIKRAKDLDKLLANGGPIVKGAFVEAMKNAYDIHIGICKSQTSRCIDKVVSKLPLINRVQKKSKSLPKEFGWAYVFLGKAVNSTHPTIVDVVYA